MVHDLHVNGQASGICEGFFWKCCNPYGLGPGEPVSWSCRNVSACAIATMREVFDKD